VVDYAAYPSVFERTLNIFLTDWYKDNGNVDRKCQILSEQCSYDGFFPKKNDAAGSCEQSKFDFRLFQLKSIQFRTWIKLETAGTVCDPVILTFDLWPNTVFIGGWGIVMDYPWAKFGVVCTFSRFGFIVRTNTHIQNQRRHYCANFSFYLINSRI